MRKNLFILAAFLNALFLGIPITATAYNHWLEMVPMSDGTRLSTEIFSPESGDGPWPVILVRTPYAFSGFREYLSDFTEFGYATVLQNTRGRFDSEGEDRVFMDDGWTGNRDGYDTVEWIASQSWCDGNIGTEGSSAMGITQLMMAPAVPPHLTCQFIDVACPSLYHDAVFQNGTFRNALVEGWLSSQDSLHMLPEFEAHPDYSDYWYPVNCRRQREKVNVPAIHRGGWYDIYVKGTIDAYMDRQHHGADGARGNQYLIMGPWTHSGQDSFTQGDLTFPDGSRYWDQFPTLYPDWFEYWLKGESTGIPDLPHVHYYVMGDVDDAAAPGNEWRSADDWPIDHTSRNLYLHSDGSLDWSAPTAFIANRSFHYDPADPVPTLGGANLNIPAGSYDQRSIENRPDVLLFETPVLTEPLEIIGQVICRLYLSSDAPDTDITVKLTDVYPDGRSMLICDGVQRVRYRHGPESQDLMTPGEMVEIEVDLWSTAIVFNTGHKIRIAVSSSNYPRFDPNPNTGHAFRANSQQHIAKNTIHLDRYHSSTLILPVTSPIGFPTPEPTPVMDQTGVKLSMPRTHYSGGDRCWLDVFIYNNSDETLRDVLLFCLMEVGGNFWYYPSWSTTTNWQALDAVKPGSQQMLLLAPFYWPSGLSTGGPVTFYSALTTSSGLELIGVWDLWQFQWR